MKKFSFRQTPLRKIVQAALITVGIAACIHLCFVSVVSLLRRDISYINPLDFLGFSIVFPAYRDSSLAAAIGWLLLATLFFVVLYISIHYHLYVAVIRESKVGKKLEQVSKNLKTIPSRLPSRSSKNQQ